MENQPTWDMLTDEQRQSVLDGMRARVPELSGISQPIVQSAVRGISPTPLDLRVPSSPVFPVLEGGSSIPTKGIAIEDLLNKFTAAKNKPNLGVQALSPATPDNGTIQVPRNAPSGLPAAPVVRQTPPKLPQNDVQSVIGRSLMHLGGALRGEDVGQTLKTIEGIDTERDENDPKSEVSKLIQKALKTIDPEGDYSKVTAKAAKVGYPQLYQSIMGMEGLGLRQRTLDDRRKKDEAMVKNSAGSLDNRTFRNTEEMATHYKSDAAVQNSLQRVDALRQIITFAKNATSQDDMAMVYAFNKLLDPMGIVREGEAAAAANTAGLAPGVWQYITKTVTSGEKLPEEVRQNFVKTARKVLEQRMSTQEMIDGLYKSRADAAGLDASKIVYPWGSMINGAYEGNMGKPATISASPSPAETKQPQAVKKQVSNVKDLDKNKQYQALNNKGQMVKVNYETAMALLNRTDKDGKPNPLNVEEVP